MKASFVALLFVLLISQLHGYGWHSFKGSQNTDQTRESNTCIVKNKFLENLWKRDVRIYSQPSIAFKKSRCDYEWKPHKTCCDLDSLIEYAKKDQQFTADAVSFINQKFAQFFNPLTELIEGFQKVEKNLKSLSQATGQKKQVIDVMMKLNLTSFKNMMAEKDIGNLFQIENRKCWELYIVKRSSALCQTCSGRGEKFFNGPRALVASDTCEQILAECSRAFDMTVDFIEIVGVLAEEFDKFIDPIYATPEYASYRSTASHLIGDYGRHAYSHRNDIGQVNRQYYHEVREEEKKPFKPSQAAKRAKQPIKLLEEAKFLCSKFLRLSESPFIEEIAAHFDLEPSLFEQAVQLLKSSGQEAPQKLYKGIPVDSHWKSKNSYYNNNHINKSRWEKKKQINWKKWNRRRLQSTFFPPAAFAADPFVGDVQVMAPVDNAYSSFLGAQGTSNLATNTGLTLNLTGIAP